MANAFETVTIIRKGAADVRFKGRLVAEIDSRTVPRATLTKGRFTRLQVWELEDGDWVAAAIACSEKAGDIDFSTTCERLGSDTIGGRQAEAMAVFEHSWIAKEMARREGWDVTEDWT